MPKATRLFAILLAGTALAACDDITGSAPSFLNCDRVRDYDLGQTVNGSLTRSDCTLASDASFVDFYELDLRSSGPVTIVMRSNDLDSYLFLIDEFGDLVASDDDGDSGSALGARIDVDLQPGTYYIAANSFDAGATGDYQLTSF